MIAALFLFSCSDEGKEVFDETKFKVSQNFKVDENKNFEISRIEESRCPIGVTCVWEGEAKIFFILKDGNVSKTDSTAVSGTTKKDTIFENLVVEITKVDPYPEKDKAINQSDYTVSMKVTKL
jgi:hypothetical protein